MRVGIGNDIHRLAKGRKLVIGGVIIPSDKGEIAHSDGDVLIHAIIDAVLGATAMGDIGALFPDDEMFTENMDSTIMLREVLQKTKCRIVNLDSTVHIEAPKLRPHIDAIRENLSKIMNIPVSAVSVKAKTAEGLGPVGEGLAIAADAVILLEGVSE